MIQDLTRLCGFYKTTLKNRRSFASGNRTVNYETLETRQLLAVLATSPDGAWHNLDQEVIATSTGQNLIETTSFGLFDAQENVLLDLLDQAPLEFTPGFAAAAVEFNVPTPNGGFERFAIVEAPVMHPDLSAKFPGIKTYRGQGIDQPAATVRLDYTEHGFHAQVLSPDGRYYVDPYYHLQTDLYMSYYSSDLLINPDNANSSEAVYSDTGELIFEYYADERGDAESDHEHEHPEPFPASISVGQVPDDSEPPGPTPPSLAPDFGTQLRTYQTAVAATGEYTAFHGGTVSAGQAAIVTAINRVTGIYENDVAVRLQLVPNNNLLVFTNGGTDPYTNNNGPAMLSQNQSTVDSFIGSANYDVGHVFSTGGGGVASLAVIGQNGAKARGVTGLPSPIGDTFYVDFVAHEMGHQFGGNHTFNGGDGNCAGGNRNGSTAYEPGSGSTIQAYAGICGSDNLQNNSDAMFHSISIDEIRIEVTTGTGDSSATKTNTGNAVPVVDAGSNFIIPDQTPFELAATGSDPNGNSTLTYSWEQRNLGPQLGVNASDIGSSPIFRTWLPTTDPTRVFPRMLNVLNGNTVVGEQYPTTNWNTMDFRVVLRDNASGGGGVVSDDMTVRVVNSGTGFDVTSQATATTLSGLATETITWNVAGTNSGLINTPNVDIFFSLDGYNYDIVLATGVPNDGSHDITVPNVDTTTGRFKVKGSGNVFFDVNRANITVNGVEVAEIKGLHIFYENSAWDDPDGNGAATGAGANMFDDLAIADKQALLLGDDALFINYTSYSRGINGIMVDVEGLGAVPTPETITSFFTFRVGNDDTYTSPGWTTAPAPIDVTFRPGDGDMDSDRITLIWADNVIEKQWLEVTMLANGSTNLPTPHVHFWGNAIGETGNDPANATVNATDQTGTRDNFTTFLDPADIMNPYDFNRDTRVNATDQTIARDNFTSFFTVLQLIEPPAPAGRGLGDGGSPPQGDDSFQLVTNFSDAWRNVYDFNSAWKIRSAGMMHEVRATAENQIQQNNEMGYDPVWEYFEQDSRRFDGEKIRIGETSEFGFRSLDTAFGDSDLIDEMIASKRIMG